MLTDEQLRDIEYSALGHTPICDKCKQFIKEGDEVLQTFKGHVVTNEDNEFLVIEETYTLNHINCI